jgi:hypothetical protein
MVVVLVGHCQRLVAELAAHKTFSLGTRCISNSFMHSWRNQTVLDSVGTKRKCRQDTLAGALFSLETVRLMSLMGYLSYFRDRRPWTCGLLCCIAWFCFFFPPFSLWTWFITCTFARGVGGVVGVSCWRYGEAVALTRRHILSCMGFCHAGIVSVLVCILEERRIPRRISSDARQPQFCGLRGIDIRGEAKLALSKYLGMFASNRCLVTI